MGIIIDKKELLYSELEIHHLYENDNFIRKAAEKLKEFTWKKLKNKLKKSFMVFVSWAKQHNIDKDVVSIFNKYTGNNYNNLNDYTKIKIQENINEGEWMDEAGRNLYNALSFYPLLQAFIELDKLVKGAGGADLKYVMIYALIWVSIISGKIIKDGIVNKKKLKALTQGMVTNET